ncbi:MAG: hypothetical protein II857_03055 [Selenomonadaceae bacterium]|nr:hypothetical protein [Selenomonadaceae bacterium]
MNQRGFATLEVILMVMVIGILASIAVPRFTNVTAAANTAKIQADLSTIETAVAIYKMEYGEDKTPDFTALKNAGYLQAKPQAPSGSAYMQKGESANTSTVESISATADYTITYDSTTKAAEVKFDGLTADKFYLPKKTTPSGE